MSEIVAPASQLIDAATIVGILADPLRRKVVAAMILGATSVDDISVASGMSRAESAGAIARVAATGLVVKGDDGAIYLIEAAFAAAARAAKQRPKSAEHDGLDSERRRVFEAFVVDGRIRSIPTSHAKRLVLLDWLAQDFEVGRRYSEPMVNLILGKRHADTAAWRRYLVDHEFLDREHGEYWRSGGSVAV